MEGNQERSDRRIVGGVDTHKDLHVAAVVDESDRVLASQCFATTRHGYKQMVAWMRGFGLLQRVGIEATGSYGAGLLRAVAARRVALQVIQNTIVCAPDELRESLRKLTRMQLIRTLAAWRPDLADYRNVTSAYRITLKSLGRRYLELHDEIADLDTMIVAIVDELAPNLVARNSIGYESAAQLLLTAGDNVQRLRSEASFAALCGVSPVPASSGKTTRHRLSRGGDRAANSALHIIAIGRLRTDPRTQAYVAKRITEGHSKLEAVRCVKRYIAREVFALIKQRPQVGVSVPTTA